MSFIQLWRWCFPAPISLIGFVFASFIRASGGQIEKHGIAWEASDGAASRLLWLFNPWANINAITLGHVILARDPLTAAHLRAHEQVHVRQYERWGFIFPLAYVMASVLAFARGADAYRDNVFEIEAFAAGGLNLETAVDRSRILRAPRQ